MTENLPAVPDDAVIDGAVVSGADAAARHVTVPPYARVIGRHAAYVAAGAVVAVRRWHLARTRHERMARSAEAAGDHESVLKWQQQKAHERQERREFWLGLLEALPALAKALPVVLVVSLVGPGVLGVFWAFRERNLAAVTAPYFWAGRLAGWCAEALSLAWLIGSVAVPLGVLLSLHWLGRHAGDMAPRWTVAVLPEARDAGIVVTADTIVLALQNVQVTPLTRAFRDGWRPVFERPPVRDGRGYQAVFSLPLGVTADMVADQRPVLARNLHRDEIEVWPSAAAPGYASLWVADRGAVSKAAPEYPLLHEGQADVFEGVPGGVVARGDGALIPVVGNNGVLGGMMGQGKSNGGRVLVLGCATDPLCALDVHVFANNGDFDAYEPRLAVYRKGLDDDVIEAAAQRLEQLYEDVAAREQMLSDLGAKKVSRQLAEQHPELRPHVALFSECHELFGHPEFGELAGELAVKTIKRARKTGVVLWFDTQSSRKSAIPPALVELVSVNCCFAVKSWRSNDGFLGDGSFAAGIRATELRPGRDRGTSLVTGISDAQFELLKWYFVPVDDDTGYDAAAEVIARCMKDVAPGTAVGGGAPLPAIESRDLLTDLAEVLRGDAEPVRIADVPARLRKLAPNWRVYRELSGTQLRGMLGQLGVRTTNTGNVPRLDPIDLRRAMAEREEVDSVRVDGECTVCGGQNGSHSSWCGHG